MEIYEEARAFMARNGNPGQWIGGYPQESVVRRDLESGHLFVGEPDHFAGGPGHAGTCGSVGDGLQGGSPRGRDASLVAGVFCYRPGPEPTYARIEDGAWPGEEPYYVLHRIASGASVHGFAAFVFDWCLQQFPVLRVDTHGDNRPMLHLLSKAGFRRCGIIHVENGTPRIAFQKSRV